MSNPEDLSFILTTINTATGEYDSMVYRPVGFYEENGTFTIEVVNPSTGELRTITDAPKSGGQ